MRRQMQFRPAVNAQPGADRRRYSRRRSDDGSPPIQCCPCCIHDPLLSVADGPHPSRQYAGLALVLVAYVGGIVGWSCAVLNVSSPSTSDAGPAQASPPVFMRTTLEEQGSPPSSRQTLSHAQFDRMLQMYVDAEGTVEYEARQARGNPTLAPSLQMLQMLDAARLAPSTAKSVSPPESTRAMRPR